MTSSIVYAEAGDVLDALIRRVDNLSPGRVEEVLDANPGLATHGTHLPAGLAVALPAANPGLRRAAESLNLWD